MIAKILDDISDYNIIATTVENAFSRTIKLLRKTNNLRSVENVLCDEEKREMAARAYKIYHGLLNVFDEVNIYQIKYLNTVASNHEDVDKAVLATLATVEEGFTEEYIDGDDVYTKYMNYVKVLNSLGCKSCFTKKVDLGLENIDRFFCSCSLLKLYIEDKGTVTRMKSLHDRWSSRYSFENDKYKIVIPETIADLLDESSQQHNCLYTMIEDDILKGYSTVIFMRDKNNLKKSHVTIEIRGGEISQAKRVCDGPCTSEDKSFLLDFVKETGLRSGALGSSNDCEYMRIPDFINEEPFDIFRAEFMSIPETPLDNLPFA